MYKSAKEGKHNSSTVVYIGPSPTTPGVTNWSTPTKKLEAGDLRDNKIAEAFRNAQLKEKNQISYIKIKMK